MPRLPRVCGLADGVIDAAVYLQGLLVVLLGPLQVAAVDVDEAQVAEVLGLAEGVIDAAVYLQGLLVVLLGPLEVAAVTVDEAQVAEVLGLAEGVIDAAVYLQGLLVVLLGPLQVAAVGGRRGPGCRGSGPGRGGYRLRRSISRACLWCSSARSRSPRSA